MCHHVNEAYPYHQVELTKNGDVICGAVHWLEQETRANPKSNQKDIELRSRPLL